MKALEDLAAQGDQVFMNTHSSVLVADDAEYQTIFKVEKVSRETDIAPILPEGKPSVIYELLGGSPADLLLPRNFLIVEGRCEYELLSAESSSVFILISLPFKSSTQKEQAIHKGAQWTLSIRPLSH